MLGRAADLSLFPDHDETVYAGDAFYLPPGPIPVGHAPGSRIVQFSAIEKLQEMEAVTEDATSHLGTKDPLILIRCGEAQTSA
jgi:hypothetical protein